MKLMHCLTVLTILSCTPVYASPCTLEKAIYGNIKTDYELTFPSLDNVVTEHPALIHSVSTGLKLEGTVTWSNGAARPYLSLYAKDQKIEYSGEIYGLAVNKKRKVINQGFSSPGYPANEAILIPNLSAFLYNALKPSSFDIKLPEDVFYFAKCK